jgi:hypothetical protein
MGTYIGWILGEYPFLGKRNVIIMIKLQAITSVFGSIVPLNGTLVVVASQP